MKVVYKISSITKPKRIYVGSAINFNSRKYVHLSQLRNNKHGNIKLQRHFNKYGENDLIFSIIKIINNKQDLIPQEQFYIDLLNPYFNICKIAGSNAGRKFGPLTEDHRKKISTANSGKYKEKNNPSTSIPILKYSLSGELIKTYPSVKEAQRSEGIRVRKFTNTNKTIGGFVWITSNSVLPDFKKISESLSNYKKIKCLPVLQIDKAGNVVNEFEGIRIAGRKTGIDHRSIQSVAAGNNHKRHTAGGFIWKYKMEAA